MRNTPISYTTHYATRPQRGGGEHSGSVAAAGALAASSPASCAAAGELTVSPRHHRDVPVKAVATSKRSSSRSRTRGAKRGRATADPSPSPSVSPRLRSDAKSPSPRAGAGTRSRRPRRRAKAHRPRFTIPEAARGDINPFVAKLLEIVETTDDAVIAWQPAGTSFVVHDPDTLAAEVLGKHFKSNKYASFVRQLNFYGFHKVPDSAYANEFTQPRLQRDNWASLATIRRKTSAAFHAPRPKEHVQQLKTTVDALRSTVADLREQLRGALRQLTDAEADRDTALDEVDRLRERQGELESELVRCRGRARGRGSGQGRPTPTSTPTPSPAELAVEADTDTDDDMAEGDDGDEGLIKLEPARPTKRRRRGGRQPASDSAAVSPPGFGRGVSSSSLDIDDAVLDSFLGAGSPLPDLDEDLSEELAENRGSATTQAPAAFTSHTPPSHPLTTAAVTAPVTVARGAAPVARMLPGGLKAAMGIAAPDFERFAAAPDDEDDLSWLLDGEFAGGDGSVGDIAGGAGMHGVGGAAELMTTSL